MQINSVVIHEIIKDANTMQAEVFLTDELLDIDNEEIKRTTKGLAFCIIVWFFQYNYY